MLIKLFTNILLKILVFSAINKYHQLSEAKRTAIIFTLSSLIMSIANMITGIITISWVEPYYLGYWNSMIVFQTYSIFIQLGVFTALNRELPYYMGKGDEEKAKKLASAALFISKLCTIISAVFFFSLLLYLILINRSNYYFIFTIIGVGFVTTIQFYQNYLQVTFRTNKSFKKLSNVYFIQTIIILVSVLLISIWKFEGMVIRFIITSFSLVLIMHYQRPLKISPKLLKNELKLLIKTGIPLFSLGYLQNITTTFNRLVLISVSGIIAVGYYSPALAIISTLKLFPSIVSQYLYPQMSYEVGKSNDKNKLWEWVWKSTLYITLLMIPITIIGWFILPKLITIFFPKYITSIVASKLALFSGIFSGSLVGLNVLYSLKAWKTIVFVTIIKLVLYWFLLNYFAKRMNPLDGVATGLLIADTLFFIFGIGFCYYELKLKKVSK